MQLRFEEVKGYKTYENARKRGEEVQEQLKNVTKAGWVVVALPNGRFAPSFIVGPNDNPGWFLGSVNVCCMN